MIIIPIELAIDSEYDEYKWMAIDDNGDMFYYFRMPIFKTGANGGSYWNIANTNDNDGKYISRIPPSQMLNPPQRTFNDEKTKQLIRKLK